MRIEKITSDFDGLMLEAAITAPPVPKGIIQFSHGMAEHKERYFDFMNDLSGHGYVCVIHDHRGHGESFWDSKVVVDSIRSNPNGNSRIPFDLPPF